MQNIKAYVGAGSRTRKCNTVFYELSHPYIHDHAHAHTRVHIIIHAIYAQRHKRIESCTNTQSHAPTNAHLTMPLYMCMQYVVQSIRTKGGNSYCMYQTMSIMPSQYIFVHLIISTKSKSYSLYHYVQIYISSYLIEITKNLDHKCN
jgi:hypothetical protein